ncbi:MAG TPA: hypothetical protein VN081_04990 [Dongiaceae bacterium]|nr:hypothetical protein [Dongiaceae bacterium]
MKFIDKLYLFIAHLIHGKDHSAIDFDADLSAADGYFVCYHKEKQNGVERTMRQEHPFYVTNRSLLKNKERILAARIISNAVKLGYNPQYVLFLHDVAQVPTEEQIERGVTAACLFRGVYTQLGPIDPVEFAIEYSKYQKRVDEIIETGVAPKKFDFTGRPSRFSDRITKRALDIATTPRGLTPLSLLADRYTPAKQNSPIKPFRTKLPFQPRIAFEQTVGKYRVSEKFPEHFITHAR